MVDKKLVATTVSSREQGMQRRMETVTTSSHEETNQKIQNKKKRPEITSPSKSKDSKKVYFTRENGRTVASSQGEKNRNEDTHRKELLLTKKKKRLKYLHKKKMKTCPIKKKKRAQIKIQTKTQDSHVSFQEEVDQEIDATENEEDWIEYIKRSTKEAEEHMEKHKITCWIETHRRQKWRMARRIITLPVKRCNRRFSTGILGLDTSIRARRLVGRPKRRWEDDLNEFMKTEEGQKKDKYDLKNNNSWMDEIQDYKKWKENEEKFSKIW